MRRRAGVGAIQKQRLEAEKYKDKGTELQESQFEQMVKQMEALKENLEEFASKHRSEIKKNPQFRRQFQEMCAAIGVDPLASAKGFWSVLGMGDFFYELSVQVVAFMVDGWWNAYLKRGNVDEPWDPEKWCWFKLRTNYVQLKIHQEFFFKFLYI